MTRILNDISAEMTRLGWSVNRASTLLAVDEVCSSRTASRYLSGAADTVTTNAEAILDWLEKQSGSVSVKEADSALKSCVRKRFQAGFSEKDNFNIK